MALDIAKLEERIDKTAIASQPVSMAFGGLMFSTMLEVMEFAKLMAVSGSAVPGFLRGNPGGCLAICTRALRWGMDPFAVAEKAYQVVNKGEERLAFESQLVHAVIESRAPLQGRLRYEIIGADDERRCKVWGVFKNERDPHVFISETLGKLREARGRNQYGGVKGSPLWEDQPEVQLFYSASRQWCRMFAPEVLLGVYTREELAEQGFDRARDVTPRPPLAERLRKGRSPVSGQRGFSAQHVEDHLGPQAEAKPADATPATEAAASGEKTAGVGTVEAETEKAAPGPSEGQPEASDKPVE